MLCLDAQKEEAGLGEMRYREGREREREREKVDK